MLILFLGFFYLLGMVLDVWTLKAVLVSQKHPTAKQMLVIGVTALLWPVWYVTHYTRLYRTEKILLLLKKLSA